MNSQPTGAPAVLPSPNELTGEIPAELGNLHELEELHLHGNSHEGCIPAGLERFSFTIHDFSNPGLRYCNDDR